MDIMDAMDAMVIQDGMDPGRGYGYHGGPWISWISWMPWTLWLSRTVWTRAGVMDTMEDHGCHGRYGYPGRYGYGYHGCHGRYGYPGWYGPGPGLWIPWRTMDTMDIMDAMDALVIQDGMDPGRGYGYHEGPWHP